MIKNKNLGFLCTSTAFGGLELNAVKLAGWLKQRGWNIYFFTLKDAALIKKANEAGLKVVIIPKWFKYADFGGANALSIACIKYEINNIIINTNRDLDLAAFYKTFFNKNIRLLYLQQMQLGVSKKDIIHTWRFNALNYWIAPLQILAKQVKEKTKINPSKVNMIPLAIDVEKFANNNITKEEARKLLNVPEDAIIAGIIGRIDEQKGQLTLIKAIKILKAKGLNVKCLIVGSKTLHEAHKYETAIREYITANVLENDVYLRPFNEKVEMVYKAFDLFVMASKWESFGMVTVESMASGIPVIGTNAGGTVELLDKGKLGTLFEPFNEQELAEKIEEFLKNKTPFLEKAKKAQAHIEQFFSHKYQCERIEALLMGRYYTN